MRFDHKDAALRHWHDGSLLERQPAGGRARLENDDQLYGLAAECALKAVLVGLGVKRPDNTVDTPFRVHIDDLWTQFLAYVGGGVSGRLSYAARLAGDPFADWSVDQRYCADGEIDAATVEAHRKAAFQAMLTLQDAMADGVVR